MCGISGILRDRTLATALPLVEVLESMAQCMVHRGPDDQGLLMAEASGMEVGLVHRRLSIIDLSPAGRGPMPNEDRTVWIVYNGEVYNFPELRRELLKRGHTFRSNTDTEVVLHLYEEYGESCIDKLRGMFAFGIWDSRKKQLLLARDRFGIKPLYYFYRPDLFVFASDLRTLLSCQEVPRDIDLLGLDAYLLFGYVPSPRTILKGVYKLPPAHFLKVRIEGGEIVLGTVQRYFTLEANPDRQRSREATVAQVRTLLEEAVRIRLVSDVPVGAFLSGGLDSSAIVAVMSKVFEHPVKTFSIGFEEEEFDERHFARIVAQEMGTEHHELVLTSDRIEEAFETVFRYLDEPLGDPSVFNNYFVSQLAREHVTVALAGDGGDEIFAGYDRYVREKGLYPFFRLPRPLKKLAALGLGYLPPQIDAAPDLLRRLRRLSQRAWKNPVERYLERMFLFDVHERVALYRTEVLEAVGEAQQDVFLLESMKVTGDIVLDMQMIDLHTYIPEDLMVKADRMSMCHSLEVRVPFLDHKLVEFALTIPSAWNLRSKESRKGILREAVRDLVPERVLQRGKKGFSLPYGEWLKGPLRDIVEDHFFFGESWIYEFVDRSYVKRLIEAQRDGRFGSSWRVWNLLVLEMWGRLMLGSVGLVR